VWEEQLRGRRLRFHLCGINNQNFVMCDEETGSWWQQATGEAFAGPLRGSRLRLVRADEVAFGIWRREHPGGRVLRPGATTAWRTWSADWEAKTGRLPVVAGVPGADGRGPLPPRTVVLGDSMIEGLGLADQDRLTNILEKDTGREYLNFGTSGDFGPLQYALLYKTLAAKFDHDTVVVGVLPDNDFHDMSLEWGKVHHADRYRPYYADDFSIVYTNHVQPRAGEGFWDRVESVLRAYLASYHVGQFLYSSMYWRMAPPYSGYNDFNDVDIARLRKALDDIHATADAHHARMAVILIPTSNDFLRLKQSGANRLGPAVLSWGQEKGLPVKDLLPDMDARSCRLSLLACIESFQRRR